MERRRTTNGSRTNEGGFTLTELLIVVALIMILAVAGMPKVMKAATHEPVVRATHELMDTMRYAKNSAVTSFRAHELRILDGGDGQLARFEVHRRSGPRCTDAAGFADEVRRFSLDDTVRLAEGSGTAVTVEMVGRRPDGLSTLCFTPDGRMLNADTNQPVQPPMGSPYAAGEAQIDLQRFEGDEPAGPRHRVIVPYNGAPHFERNPDADDGEA